MTESEAPPHPESFTAWHPMLVALLEAYLPSGWQLIPELLLSRLPYGAQYMRLKKLKDPADLCLMVPTSSRRSLRRCLPRSKRK